MLTCAMGGEEDDKVESLVGIHFSLSHCPSMLDSDADKKMMVRTLIGVRR
jgi:hypothetical protein